MAGLPRTKDDINNRSGQLVIGLRNTFTEIDRFKVLLDGMTDVELTALGFTTGEVTTLRNSFGDLAKLSRISRAADTQPAVSDFFFHAKNLMGVM